MNNKDIRWQQRFQNFENAFRHLKDAVDKTNLSELEKAGVIQIYEFTFELAWKTVKDYLEEKKVAVNFPRDTIKEAFKYSVIENGDTWMDMLEKRNLMSHTYNEATAELAYNLITKIYFIAIEQVYNKLKAETAS